VDDAVLKIGRMPLDANIGYIVGSFRMSTAQVVMADVTFACIINSHPAGTGGLSSTFGVTLQHSMSSGPGQKPGVDV
jgi:hypothetical protein